MFQVQFINQFTEIKYLYNSIFQGMLEGLDKEICDFFESYPEAKFVSQKMTSYERLLAHACSMYYQLKSQSEFFKEFF